MYKLDKNAFLWSLYDFSNSIFLTNFLIIYFPQWILNEKGLPDIVYSVTVALVAVLSGIFLPSIGALSDLHNSRMRFFRIFVTLTWITSLITALSANFIPNSLGILLAIIFFALAYFNYQPTLVIYDSMLSQIAEKKNQAFISGIGIMFGYVGQVIGLLVVAPFINRFQNLGASAAFLPTSFLFIVLSLPTLIWLKESKISVQKKIKKLKIKEAYTRAKTTIKNIRSYKNVFNFFLSFFFYSNAVVAVTAFTVVYAEKVLGFVGQSKIPLFIAGTGTAIIGALLCGLITNRLGLKNVLMGTLIGWLICFTFGAVATTQAHGWVLALILGLLTGFTWTISRLVVIKLSPKEKITEFFGFFGLAGKLATTIGPLWWGLMVLIFSYLDVFKYRIALMSMNLLIIVALLFFQKIIKTDFK